MARPRLLDLFSGAGGAARGYQEAGFYVVGVDVVDQPNYCGEEFVQADALDFLRQAIEDGVVLGEPAHAIHASPPCPRYSAGSKNWNGRPDDHPDLIDPVRELLRASGLPYVIENVPGAPLRNPTMLCGSSFGLRVRRHRLFETSFPIMAPPCAHYWQQSNPHRLRAGYEPPDNSIVPVYGGGQAGFDVETCRAAMDIDWMTTDELNDAIPPAYTKFVGEQLLTHLHHTDPSEKSLV